MKPKRPHANVSKVKVRLPDDPAGAAHLFQMRADGVLITFMPGKGKRTKIEPRLIPLARLAALRTSARLARTEHGTPAEEVAATLADLLYLQKDFARGELDGGEVLAIREQLRRMEKTLGKI